MNNILWNLSEKMNKNLGGTCMIGIENKLIFNL